MTRIDDPTVVRREYASLARGLDARVANVLELPFGENHRVTIEPRGVRLADPVTGLPRGVQLQAAWTDDPEAVGFAAFRAQVDDWLGAIRSGHEPPLSGRSALPAVRLIDECYRSARPLREPWTEEGLPPLPEANGSAVPFSVAICSVPD